MTTPLSKMVALLIPSPLTPKRGLGSAGSLSEAKKGVAKVCGDRSSSVGDYSRQRTPSLLIRGRLESPKDLQGLMAVHVFLLIQVINIMWQVNQGVARVPRLGPDYTFLLDLHLISLYGDLSCQGILMRNFLLRV